MKLLSAILLIAAASAQQTVAVKAQRVSRTITLPGEFLPYEQVDLHARVAGFLETIEADRGSVVKSGQLLARLSAPELDAQRAEAEAKAKAIEAQRREAEAKLVAAESTAERLRTAAKTPGAVAANEVILAQKAVDAARALADSLARSMQAAEAAVKAVEQLQSYRNITAPFDGVITERYAHPGALAGPQHGPLLRLERLSRLRLVVAVPEANAGSVSVGARVSFTVPAHPGETFTGVVARAARSLDAKTRTMPVELDVANAAGRLAPGMFPSVEWPAGSARPVLLVPKTAVVTTTERTFVIRSENGKAKWVNVTKGAASGDLVEVMGALRDGDQVVLRATDEIREGAALR